MSSKWFLEKGVEENSFTWPQGCDRLWNRIREKINNSNGEGENLNGMHTFMNLVFKYSLPYRKKYEKLNKKNPPAMQMRSLFEGKMKIPAGEEEKLCWDFKCRERPLQPQSLPPTHTPLFLKVLFHKAHLISKRSSELGSQIYTQQIEYSSLYLVDHIQHNIRAPENCNWWGLVPAAAQVRHILHNSLWNKKALFSTASLRMEALFAVVSLPQLVISVQRICLEWKWKVLTSLITPSLESGSLSHFRDFLQEPKGTRRNDSLSRGLHLW